jgi:iron(III) transport system ATP-binding protein
MLGVDSFSNRLQQQEGKSMSSVEISGVRKLYGAVVALSEIDISIKSGQFYTLLGPSGCGKTTLLRTIAGFHFQNSGTITVDGTEIQELPAHKRNVAMVFQDYAVFPHLNVFDNVAFGLKQRKVDHAELEDRVEHVLRMVQLKHFAKRMPHELSGGQQQRVGLARAIVVESSVLLMDEPLSNLDAKLRVELRAELRKIQQSLGMTTVYVTHDQEEALAMSDVVCVMYNGVIQQAASPIEIYAQPANKFVASFVGGNNFLRLENRTDGIYLIAINAKLGAQKLDSAVVAAIRPELITIQKTASVKKAEVSIEAVVEQISFIGREIEIHVVATNGEVIKSITRPSPEVLSMAVGDVCNAVINRDDFLLFEDAETGVRIV